MCKRNATLPERHYELKPYYAVDRKNFSFLLREDVEHTQRKGKPNIFTR